MENLEPIFSQEEIKENEQKKEKLAELLIAGEGVLMAGAGCSASIYPDWQGFVNLLYDEAVQVQNDFLAHNPNEEDFLSFADRVKSCIGAGTYYNIIHQCFKEKEKTHEKFHESLGRLLINNRLKGITTTNYDMVLEHALSVVIQKHAGSVWIDKNMEEAMVLEFLLSLNHGSVPKRILHIHGIYHQKDSIILSRSEYETKYGFKLRKPPATIYEAIREGDMKEEEFSDLLKDYGLVWTTHRKLLWALFATRRLIIIGFSLNDPYFNKMLEFVSSDLHTYGYDMHYFIYRLKRGADDIKNKEQKEKALFKAKKLKKKFGIETIFFEDDDLDKGLENFIYEIEKQVSIRTIGTKEGNDQDKRIEKLQVEPEGDEELTKFLIEQSKQI